MTRDSGTERQLHAGGATTRVVRRLILSPNQFEGSKRSDNAQVGGGEEPITWLTLFLERRDLP